MPEVDFHVEGAEPVAYAAEPTLGFKVRIAPAAGEDAAAIHSIALCCQIRLEPGRRRYTPSEQERLGELFGEAHRWGQTVRSMLWTHVNANVGGFVGQTVFELPVPCTFDFNVAGTKYFDALADGVVPLSFLFSGSLFYAEPADGALRVMRISWEKEAAFGLPVATWKRMMDWYYPNSAWLCLGRDAFDRLQQYKRRQGLPTWERALEKLLDQEEAGGIALATDRAQMNTDKEKPQWLNNDQLNQ